MTITCNYLQRLPLVFSSLSHALLPRDTCGSVISRPFVVLVSFFGAARTSPFPSFLRVAEPTRQPRGISERPGFPPKVVSFQHLPRMRCALPRKKAPSPRTWILPAVSAPFLPTLLALSFRELPCPLAPGLCSSFFVFFVDGFSSNIFRARYAFLVYEVMLVAIPPVIFFSSLVVDMIDNRSPLRATVI